MNKQVGLCFLAFLFSFRVFAYDIVESYTLFKDRNGADDYFRPFGHNFVLDINAAATDGISSFISDISDATDVQGTTQQKINQVTASLQKVNNEEHFVKARLGLAIPLPKFRAFGTGVTPSLKGTHGLGAAVSITNRTAAIDPALLAYATQLGISTTDINAQLYIREESKAGLNTLLTPNEQWEVETFLHWFRVWDRREVVSATQIVTSKNVIDLDKVKNLQAGVAADASISRVHKENDVVKWKVSLGVEDVKLATTSDRKDVVGDLVYDVNPLWRAHGEYLFDLSLVDVKPFAGVYNRKGYDLGDGLYAGALVDFSFLPVSAIGMLDSQYLTLNPRIHLWFFHLEYSAKIPLESTTDDGFKAAMVHNLNVRFTF